MLWCLKAYYSSQELFRGNVDDKTGSAHFSCSAITFLYELPQNLFNDLTNRQTTSTEFVPSPCKKFVKTINVHSCRGEPGPCPSPPGTKYHGLIAFLPWCCVEGESILTALVPGYIALVPLSRSQALPVQYIRNNNDARLKVFNSSWRFRHLK